MAPRNDLSASEKLLELIRRSSPPPAAPPTETSAPARPIAKKINLLKRPASRSPRFRLKSFALPLPLPSRKVTTIGVDLQAENISLVKMESDAGSPRLLSQESVALPRADPGTSLPKEVVAAILGRELRRLGAEPPCEIWAAIPRKQAEIIPLTIPITSEIEPADAVLWAAKKQTEIGERLLDFSQVREATPTPNKMRALAFLAEQKAINELKQLFNESGFPLTGITLPSLAIQHLFSRRWLESPAESFVHLFLDEDQAYIDLYHERQLLFSREIKTGLSSLRAGEITAPAPEPRPEIAFPAPIPAPIEESREIELSLDMETPPGGSDAPAAQAAAQESVDPAADLPAEEEPAIRFELSAIHRLVRQLERTFDHCANNLGLPRPTRLHLAGWAELPDQLLAALEAELGVPCAFLDPFAGNRLLLGGAIPPPQPYQRRRLTEAMGLALADNRQEQNFLLTSRAREGEKKVQRSNRLILSAFIILTIALAIFYGGERSLLKQHGSELARLERQIAALAAGRTSPAELMQTAASLKEKRLIAEKMTTDFRPLALIGHALERRPPEIRLGELAADAAGRLTMQGMAHGEGLRKELVLAQYLKGLADSPLVGESKITDKSNIRLQEEEFLVFAIQLAPPAPKESSPPKNDPKQGGKK